MPFKKRTHVERRQKILNAAIDLFSQKGFSRTPTSLIARKACVAEGLIFHYFKNKQGILVDILNEILEKYTQGLAEIDRESLSGMEVIEKFIFFHFQLRKSRSKAFLVLNRELVSDIISPGSEEFRFLMAKWNAILDFLKNAILQGQKDGSICNVPPEETALVIRGMLMGVSSLYRQILHIPNINAIPGEVANFIRRSLSPGAHLTIGEDQ